MLHNCYFIAIIRYCYITYLQLNADLKEQVSSGQMTEIAAEELLKQLKEQQETEKEQVSGHLEAEELEELHKVRVLEL